VRKGDKEALKLALNYHRKGYKEIRVKAEDAVYSLEQFRRLVE
jgi:hypothetical protein